MPSIPEETAMSSSPAATPSTTVARGSGVGMLLLLVLFGINLRPFLTALGPVLDPLRADIGLDYRAAAILTTLPFVLMGLLAFCGNTLVRRYGERSCLAAALLLLMLGSAVRTVAGSGTMLIVTAAVAGAGVATIQALMPGLAKRWFPQRLSLAMGLYSAALVGGGALGALASSWLNGVGGWRMSLSVWAVPALLALIAWLGSAVATPSVKQSGSPAPVSIGRFFGNRRAWLLALYFGLTNSGYSSLVAWLPSFYRQQGMAAQAAGSLLAWMALFQAAAAFLVPMLARRWADRRLALWLTITVQAAGFAGLALVPQLEPWLWVAMAGFGLGGFFSLSLIVSLEHLPQAQAAGALTAFVQGIGFLVAASGPWLIGCLRDAGGSFVTGWWLQLSVLAAMALLTACLHPSSYRPSMAGVTA
jgi:CP family cyanate transporter-like MFS transporter